MSRLYNIDNENVKNYIYSISSKLMRHFDLEYQVEIENEYFDLYAFHRNDFFKSFLTRSTVYEGYSIFEHILVRYIPVCRNEDIDNFKNMLIRISPLLSKPNKFHKRSIITGIIITDSVLDSEYLKFIKKSYSIYREVLNF